MLPNVSKIEFYYRGSDGKIFLLHLLFNPYFPFQVSATMHELQVTPLLMHKGSKSRRNQRLKRGSQSFDECAEDYSSRQYKPTRAYHRQRSNPNILDLIPPPPPLYAPPSLPNDPNYNDMNPCSSKRSKSHRASAFKHISESFSERRDSDTSEYFTQVSANCTGI